MYSQGSADKKIMKGKYNVNFYQQMFNPTYANGNYYAQKQVQDQLAQYNLEQNSEVMKVIKAMHDLCDAVKKLDNDHQQQAFVACVGVLAQEFNWN